MANRLKPVATDIPELKRQKVNRSEQISRRGDKVRNVSVSLMDVDTTIMYYFNNVINPSVEDNGTRYKVPIRYASGERWNSIQNDGFFRTARGNVILPVIVFKRNSIQKDTNIPVDSMDNNALKYTFEKRYSDANRYSNFSAQYGIQPKREFYQVAVPDYQVLNYTCIIWTDYIEQMNGIVESITRSEGKYWGEPGRFKFRNQIESFDDATELDNEVSATAGAMQLSKQPNKFGNPQDDELLRGAKKDKKADTEFELTKNTTLQKMDKVLELSENEDIDMLNAFSKVFLEDEE